jgi:AbrB family looped-hinge helix DNA binding protein
LGFAKLISKDKPSLLVKERFEVKVTSKGQITLPKHLREKLAISKESRVILEIRKGEVAMKPKRTSIVDRLVGIAKTKKTSIELHEQFTREVERKLG